MTPKEKLMKLEKEAYVNYYSSPNHFHRELKNSENETNESLLNNYKKMLNSEDFDEIKQQIEKEANGQNEIAIPTPYQNPTSYFHLLEISNIVERGFSTCPMIHKKTGKKSMLKDLGLNFERPTLGEIFFGSINAHTYPCDNGEYLIVFEAELTTFCYLLCKVIVQALPVYDPSVENFQTYSNKINNSIDKNPEIEKRFEELITAFITSGRATRAPQYFLDPKFNSIVSHLTLSMETFVMAHEYSHILLGHVDNLRYKNFEPYTLKDIQFSWNDEYNADELGVPLMIEGLRNVGYDYDNVSYCGAESYFSGFEVLEKARCLILTGNDEWYWKECCKEDGKLGLHPPSHTRRDSLRNQMRVIYGEKFLDISKIVETIIKTLWQKIKPNLIKNRNDLYIKLLSYQVDMSASHQNYSHALGLLDKILEIDNHCLPALFGKGNIFQELKKFTEADQYYDIILNIDKHNIAALVQKAKVELAKEEYEKSLELVNLALEKDRTNTHALYTKGMVFDHQENFEGAIKYFNSILRLEEKNVAALLRIAFCYSMLKKPETAVVYYDKVLEIEPQNQDALEQKLLLLDYLGNYDEIIKMVNQLLEKTPGDLDLLELKKELENEKQNQNEKK